MSNNQAELLIDHLDSKLMGRGGSPEVGQLIHNDAGFAAEWRGLNIAVDAIRDAAMHEQVMAVRKEWIARQLAGEKISKTPVFAIYKNVIRIAACVLILAGGSSVYKYMTTSSEGIYQEYYSPYELTASRSAGTADPIDQAYDNKNWARVLAIFNTTRDKTIKSYFLAGIAYLGLKNYDAAGIEFRQVMAENMRSGGDYFQDEAEYYLALSLLAENKPDQAMPLLDKIKADPYHLYHQKVAAMSFTDLHIAEYKGRK